MTEKATLSTLKIDAPVFKDLEKGEYNWWNQIKKRQQLYIEIRKDNEIHVYFEGGRLVRICKCHKLQAYTHKKYLGLDGDSYKNCINELNTEMDSILQKIKNYSLKGGPEKNKWREKYIQGHLLTTYSTKYIDSEFAYKDENTNIRIDLVECVDGKLTFVELKRIDDDRMLKIDDTDPEIINQMNQYKDFINKHKTELIDYYQKIYAIKKDLELPIPSTLPTSINEIPHLLVFNRYTNISVGKSNRIKRIEELLQRESKKFSYSIIENI